MSTDLAPMVGASLEVMERELLFGCAALGIVSLSFLIGSRLAQAPVTVRPLLAARQGADLKTAAGETRD